MNRYRVAGPHPVDLPAGSYQPGDEFDADYGHATEADLIAAGAIEIVPRSYLVVGDSIVHDTPPGSTFTAALTAGVEALLVAGGHITRADPPPNPGKEKK